MVPRIGVVFFVLFWTAVGSAGTIVRVTGRVVDAKGSPVAGARLAERWFAEQGQSLEPYRPVRSDPDGHFLLELELFNRDRIVMAIDAAGKRGGVATVSVKEPEKPLRIELAVLAELRVRYASEKPGQPLDDAYVTLLLADGLLPVASALANLGIHAAGSAGPLPAMSNPIRPSPARRSTNPSRSALPGLLAPLGLNYTIRNEAVVITTANAKARER